MNTPNPYAGLERPCRDLCKAIYGDRCSCEKSGNPAMYCVSLMPVLTGILCPPGTTVDEVAALFTGNATIKMKRKN
jgi:hypothetical protein